MNRKVTVVGGAGNVGATVARAIADKELADVVIIDIADRRRRASRSTSRGVPDRGIRLARRRLRRRPTRAGRRRRTPTSSSSRPACPRKPGMSRDDLLNVNYKIMQSVTEQIVKHSPNTIIVPVANPLDAMCQAVYRLSKFPRERVIGMAGVLDSARMRTFIAMETERVGRERPRLRARRPRRHDGAAAALFDGRRHPDHRVCCRRSGSTRSASGRPTAAPRSPSSSARAPGTRRARRPRRWSR